VFVSFCFLGDRHEWIRNLRGSEPREREPGRSLSLFTATISLFVDRYCDTAAPKRERDRFYTDIRAAELRANRDRVFVGLACLVSHRSRISRLDKPQ